MEGADQDFTEALHAIYQSIEAEIQASRVGAKAWARRFNQGQELRKEAMDRVVGGLDPK